MIIAPILNEHRGRVTRAEAPGEDSVHVLLLSTATDGAQRYRFRPARLVASEIAVGFEVRPLM